MVGETARTSLVCFCLGVLGLWGGLPKPHHDHAFLANVVRTLLAASCVKAVTAFGCVLPVLCDAYEDMFTFGVRTCCWFFPLKAAPSGQQPELL